MNIVSVFQNGLHKLRGIKLDKHADLSNSRQLPSPQQVLDSRNKVLDIRSRDCSNLDLSGYDATTITFDNNTIFPSDPAKLPQDFAPAQIMEIYKNPGLNVRQLHKGGIDGHGVSIAIIDQELSPHTEYNENIVHYEKFLPMQRLISSNRGTMHGAAVASIAVGKNVGVAPKSKLYYFATTLTDGKFKDDPKQSRTSKYYTAALDKIIKINKMLPDSDKIVVVSISASPHFSRDPEIWDAALQRARDAGIFVTTTAIRDEYGLEDNGLNRDIYDDSDNPDSYSKSVWWPDNEPVETQQKTLAFPMDHRSTASPTGGTDYVHYASGGWSWMKPYEAAMFALAKQVDRSITPEQFFEIGLQTGTYSEKARAVIINPPALISTIRDRVNARQQIAQINAQHSI